MMAEHLKIHVLFFCWWRLIRKSETKLIASIHLNCSPLHVLLFLQKLKFNFQQFRLHTVYEKINLTLLGQNGIWMKFLAFIWFFICMYATISFFEDPSMHRPCHLYYWILSKNPTLYEVNQWIWKRFAHGGVSKIFFLDHFLSQRKYSFQTHIPFWPCKRWLNLSFIVC